MADVGNVGWGEVLRVPVPGEAPTDTELTAWPPPGEACVSRRTGRCPARRRTTASTRTRQAAAALGPARSTGLLCRIRVRGLPAQFRTSRPRRPAALMFSRAQPVRRPVLTATMSHRDGPDRIDAHIVARGCAGRRLGYGWAGDAGEARAPAGRRHVRPSRRTVPQPRRTRAAAPAIRPRQRPTQTDRIDVTDRGGCGWRGSAGSVTFPG